MSRKKRNSRQGTRQLLPKGPETPMEDRYIKSIHSSKAPDLASAKVGADVQNNSLTPGRSERNITDSRTNEIRRFIKNYKVMYKPSTLLHHESFRNGYFISLCIAGGLLLNVLFHICLKYTNHKYNSYNIRHDLLTILGAPPCILYSILKLIDAPEEKKKKEDWLWKRGRLMYIIYAIGSVVLPAGVILENSLPRVSSLGAIFAISAGVCGLGWSLILFELIARPVRILSRAWTEIGSMFLLTQVCAFTAVAICLDHPTLGRNFSIFTYVKCEIALISGSWLIYELLIRFIPSSLNAMQKAILSIIHPRVLLYSLSSEMESIQTTMKALSIIDEFDKAGDYLLLKTIAEQIVRIFPEKKQSYFKKLLGLGFSAIVLIVTATVGALYESIAQELFLTRTKQIVCKLVGLLCQSPTP